MTSEEHVEIPSLYYFVLFGTFKTESHEIVMCGSIQKFMISYCVTIYLSSRLSVNMCVCACVRACVTIIWQVHQVNNYRPLEKGISLATSLGLSTPEIDSIAFTGDGRGAYNGRLLSLYWLETSGWSPGNRACAAIRYSWCVMYSVNLSLITSEVFSDHTSVLVTARSPVSSPVVKCSNHVSRFLCSFEG